MGCNPYPGVEGDEPVVVVAFAFAFASAFFCFALSADFALLFCFALLGSVAVWTLLIMWRKGHLFPKLQVPLGKNLQFGECQYWQASPLAQGPFSQARHGRALSVPFGALPVAVAGVLGTLGVAFGVPLPFALALGLERDESDDPSFLPLPVPLPLG